MIASSINLPLPLSLSVPSAEVAMVLNPLYSFVRLENNKQWTSNYSKKIRSFFRTNNYSLFHPKV